MNAKTVLITGGNRGLGLQFVKNFVGLETPPQKLIVTCRDVENATDLKAVAAAHPNVKIMKLDVENDTDEDKIDNVVKEIGSLLKGEGLNLLINNAGRNSKNEGKLSKDVLTKDFSTNVFAPLLLAKALQQYLERAAQASADPGLSCNKAAIINMSSVLASIAGNNSAGYVSYKASKAALNMVTTTLANDLGRRGVMCMSIHPGWVQTSMGGQGAPLSTEESVSGMFELFAKCAAKDNGKFYQYDGQEIPW